MTDIPRRTAARTAKLASLPLGQGAHGLNYFAFRSAGQPAAVHVTMNGTPQEALDAALLAQAWPEAPGYYSARMFCTRSAKP